MRILPLIVLLGCVVWGANGRAQEEERPAPARAGLLKRGLLAKGKQTTTTTTTAAPQEEEYVDEAEYQEGDAQASSEPPPTTTEGKKLVAGGVRPFRSNTDLLEALKRRRAQAAEAKLHHSGSAVAPVANSPQEPAADAPSKASYIKSRTNTQPKQSVSTVDSKRPIPKRGSVRPNESRHHLEYSKEVTEASRTISRQNSGTSTKRRQVKAKEDKQAATPDKVQIGKDTRSNRSNSKKRFNNAPAKESNHEEVATPAKPARARFGRPGAKALPEPEVEEQNESAPSTPVRTGRTFRRGN